jgi:urate oxidase
LINPPRPLPPFLPFLPFFSLQVYLVAKQCADPTPPDEYALRLARFLVDEYPLVSVAKVSVRASPWTRAVVGGAPHSHGFVGGGDGATPVRTAAAVARRGGPSTLTAGVDGWRLLKTTRSGYSGFLHDRHTLLPDTADRVAATSVTATWRYSGPAAYDAAYDAALAAMTGAFFGPSATGVFSPSLQFTLRAMGEAVLAAVPAADSVHLRLPNLHFVPVSPPGSDAKFDNDVYVATSEPHGTIEATLTREGGLGGAHVRLWDEGGPASRL